MLLVRVLRAWLDKASWRPERRSFNESACDWNLGGGAGRDDTFGEERRARRGMRRSRASSRDAYLPHAGRGESFRAAILLGGTVCFRVRGIVRRVASAGDGRAAWSWFGCACEVARLSVGARAILRSGRHSASLVHF